MSVRNWHPGKLIILWAWGGVAAGLSMSQFMAQPVAGSPTVHLIELIVFAAVLLSLSALTWHWLGGKESK